MSSESSQTTEASSPEASMKSLSQQVLQWQKELSEWNTSTSADDHAGNTQKSPQKSQKIPQILQDSEIHNTINTAVQALSASLPKAASEDNESSSESSKEKDIEIVNASLDVLTKAATQQTAKTLFITSGALKPISELLRKACLSQKFVVSANNNNNNNTTATTSQSFDEKKDDDGTISCSSPSSNTSTTPDASSSDAASFQTPSMALHCLANLSDNASDAIKNDYLLPIANPLIHNVMEECLHAQEIQRYACKMLYHLSNPLLQELVAAGFVEVIWKAHQAHFEDAELQQYSNACLYNLLPVCPEQVLQQTVRPQQLVQGLVPGMTAHPACLQVQKYGLLVMTRMTTPKNHPPLETSGSNSSSNSSSPTNGGGGSSFLRLSNNSNNNNINSNKPKESNALQASHALGLPHVIYAILSALHLHAKDAETAQVGCHLLKHVSRLSLDFANSMLERGGLSVLVRIMQCHLDHTSIQDPVLATIRNLLSLRANPTTTKGALMMEQVVTLTTESAAQSIRHALQAEYGKEITTTNHPNNTYSSTLAAMTRVIGLVMSIHVPDAPIQAYGCDAFGRLAALDDYAREEEDKKWIRQILFDGNALRLALQAMRVHPNHTGVQDRAIVLLLRLCSYEPAYAFMRQEKEMEGESSDDDDDEEEEEEEPSFEYDEVLYGDEYEDDSIGPVLSKSRSNASSELPQSFVYKILVQTKVSPRKESHDRLQRLLSIVDLQERTPPPNRNSANGGGTRESFTGFFKSRISVEGASERMRNLSKTFASPTASVNSTTTPTAAAAAAAAASGQRSSWASPLKQRTSRWWQSAPAANN